MEPAEMAAKLYVPMLKAFDDLMEQTKDGESPLHGKSVDVVRAYGFSLYLLQKVGEDLGSDYKKVIDQAIIDAKNRQVRL